MDKMIALSAKLLATSMGLSLTWPAAVAGPKTITATEAVSPAEVGLGAEFTSRTVSVGGNRVRIVEGGKGPLVVLLHGWPEDWTEWRHVMPLLAGKYRVVAMDLRGIGGSEATQDGYDAPSLATDAHRVVEALGRRQVCIVGHDIGGMAAYAYARLYPRMTKAAVILDVPLPGLEPWATVEKMPAMWHFDFHATARLPELLVQGRQASYFRDFINRVAFHPEAFTASDVDRYARAYTTPNQLRAGFEFYRAFPKTAQFNQSRGELLTVPLVLAGGDKATAALQPSLAKALADKGVRNLRQKVIVDSGHFVADEQPGQVAEIIKETC